MFLPQPVARNPLVRPLALPGPTVEGRKRDVRRALVHEHEAIRLDGGDHHHPESRPQELVALTRTQRPFFRPKPIFLRALERVDSLTETPATFSRYSRLSASLANGRSFTSASRSLLAFSSSRGLLPGALPYPARASVPRAPPWRSVLQKRGSPRKRGRPRSCSCAAVLKLGLSWFSDLPNRHPSPHNDSRAKLIASCSKKLA